MFSFWPDFVVFTNHRVISGFGWMWCHVRPIGHELHCQGEAGDQGKLVRKVIFPRSTVSNVGRFSLRIGDLFSWFSFRKITSCSIACSLSVHALKKKLRARDKREREREGGGIEQPPTLN